MTVVQKPNPGIERIRSQKLSVFVKNERGVLMEEAFRRADEAGLVIASNKRISTVNDSSEKYDFREAYRCWTGTIIAYEKPDQELGKEIEYTNFNTNMRYVFPVPEEHQGKKNVILVAEHPNVTFVKEWFNLLIVQATEVGIVEKFPTTNGWYLGDPNFDIPCGDGLKPHTRNATFLKRYDKLVGSVVRGEEWAFEPTLTDLMPVYKAGVVVEGTPEQVTAAARLIEQMKCK
jgi:hypothetical protein